VADKYKQQNKCNAILQTPRQVCVCVYNLIQLFIVVH